MFYSDNVQDSRQMFFSSWQNYKQKQSLTPLEKQIVDVILDHPEYHSIFNQHNTYLDKNYFPEMGETNPFLHMGLHLAIREQIATNRPQGITEVYAALLQSTQNNLEIEHIMMEQLAECLWLAQRNKQFPDEQLYLNQLNNLIGKSHS